jgi:ankyrin repeat protein
MLNPPSSSRSGQVVVAATVLPAMQGSEPCLSTLAGVENTTSSPLLDLMQRNIPGLHEAVAGLPQAVRLNLGLASRSMHHAMQQLRDQGRALYECAAAGNADAVRHMMAAGYPTDEVFRRESGKREVTDTALTAAARGSHLKVVELLVQSDRFDPQDRSSVGALDIALDTYRRKLRPGYPGDSAKIITALLAHGVSINSLPGGCGLCWKLVSERIYAAIPHVIWDLPKERGTLDAFVFMRLLSLSNDALQARDRHGRTILHWVAAFLEPPGYSFMDDTSPDLAHRWGILERLFGPDPSGHRIIPDIRDHDGKTPLHYAAGNGNVATVECLLRRAHLPNRKDNEGRTPLDDAYENGRGAVIRLLSELP